MVFQTHGKRTLYPTWLSSCLIQALEALEIADTDEELNWFLQARGY